MPFITSFHAIHCCLQHNTHANAMFFFSKESPKVKLLLNLVKKHNIEFQKVEQKTLEQFGSSHHVLETPVEEFYYEKRLLKSQIQKLVAQKVATVLIIDSVTDPHNIGAILRNCSLFSVDLVLYPKKNSAKIDTDTVARVSAGASNIVNHGQISNITQTLEILKENGFWIFGVDLKGTSLLHQQQYPKKSVFIVGSEGKGISKLVLKNCDETIRIPSTCLIQCLNVSVATGIVLYHHYINSILPDV